MTDGEYDKLLDVSRYPRHVPTVREQAKGETWDAEELIETRRDMERYTNQGLLRNPMAFRSRVEQFYDGGTPTRRMKADGADPGDPDSMTTAAVAESMGLCDTATLTAEGEDIQTASGPARNNNETA